MAGRARHPVLARALHSAGTLACALLVFYGLPLTLAVDHISDVVGLGVFVVGVLGLVLLILRQVRGYVARPSDTRGRVMGLLSIIYVVVIFFALTFYIVEQNAPEQFVGLETRTDALYYTIVTLGTVGYGDVHAAGQLARVLTMVQILFDLVVIGVLLALASSQLTNRLTVARSAHESRGGKPGGPTGPTTTD